MLIESTVMSLSHRPLVRATTPLSLDAEDMPSQHRLMNALSDINT
jgi:hypothetical protein